MRRRIPQHQPEKSEQALRYLPHLSENTHLNCDTLTAGLCNGLYLTRFDDKANPSAGAEVHDVIAH